MCHWNNRTDASVVLRVAQLALSPVVVTLSQIQNSCLPGCFLLRVLVPVCRLTEQGHKSIESVIAVYRGGTYSSFLLSVPSLAFGFLV